MLSAPTTPVPPVTAADVRAAVRMASAALSTALDRDWQVRAGSLGWTCWEAVEHVADDLFAYAGQLAPARPPQDTHVPFAWRRTHPDGPASTIFADPTAGTAGLVQVMEACGTFLAAVVETTPPRVRAHHVYGLSDPEGFAAMGVVETLVHLHDVAAGLGLDWAPPAQLCRRALVRLFPEAPTDTDPWPTLLWATGRAELEGRPQLDSWRWDGRPATERTDRETTGPETMGPETTDRET